MKSSIYISSEKIQVIGFVKAGKSVSVKDHITGDLPEGTMINGKITDPAHLTECLAALRAQKPGLFAEPDLVVDGSSIYLKKLAVPKLNKSQYQQLLAEEFADTAGALEDLVYDYHALRGSGGAASILACAADKAQVESYISTFKGASIKLRSIKIGAQAIFQYVGARPELQKTTYVLNVIDGLTMISMIFENGINVFITRTRLYSDDHEQMVGTVLENLSGLIQFTKSEKFSDITASYYLGLEENDLRLMGAISPYPDIALRGLDIFRESQGAEALPPDAHFALLGAFLGDDSIDLIKSCRALEKMKKKKPVKAWIPGLALFVLLAGAGTVFLLREISDLNREIKTVDEYIKSGRVNDTLDEIARIQSGTIVIQQKERRLRDKAEDEAAKPFVSKRILEEIISAGGKTITVTHAEYTEDKGFLLVGCRSTGEADPAEYVAKLRESGLFGEIKYGGYQKIGDGQYEFSAEAALLAEEVAE